MASPIGYQWIIDNLDLRVPGSTTISTIGEPGESYRKDHPFQNIRVFRKEYAVPDTPMAHLSFALKHEETDLFLIQCIFDKIGEDVISDFVMMNPGGLYERKIGFLYDFLTGRTLPDPKIHNGNYAGLIDGNLYFTGEIRKNKKWRIDDNLLGDRTFCPVVRKTPLISEYLAKNLGERARELLKSYSPELVHRASQYLFRKETKSSFLIERETASMSRIERFSNALEKSSSYPCESLRDFVRIQNLVVDPSYRESGYRSAQNYVGESRVGGEVVHYIAPDPQDVESLMSGLVHSMNRMQSAVPPVVEAAVVSFGFVFIHPFSDGNGRLHRFLIHKILSERGLTPDSAIFPVSSNILAHPVEYDHCLETFSKKVMALTDYSIDRDGIISRENRFPGLYRYFDATPMVEYLYKTIERVIEEDLKEELSFLVRYDGAKKEIQNRFELPDRLADLFIRLSLENNGVVSKNKQKSLFGNLPEEEMEGLREIYGNHFSQEEMPREIS